MCNMESWLDHWLQINIQHRPVKVGILVSMQLIGGNSIENAFSRYEHWCYSHDVSETRAFVWILHAYSDMNMYTIRAEAYLDMHRDTRPMTFACAHHRLLVCSQCSYACPQIDPWMKQSLWYTKNGFCCVRQLKITHWVNLTVKVQERPSRWKNWCD
jgi:hypothetical protein